VSASPPGLALSPRRWGAAAVLALAAACSSSVSDPCGNPAGPQYLVAIQVTVTDSISGLTKADSASGTMTSATASDSLWHIFLPTTMLTGIGDSGTYVVTVDRPGYQQWTKDSVVVTKTGSCGVLVPAKLSARLQPAP